MPAEIHTPLQRRIDEVGQALNNLHWTIVEWHNTGCL